MNRMRLWGAAAVIAMVVILGFIFFTPHTNDSTKGPASNGSVSSQPMVTLHDSYHKGLHTITGSVQASDPCVSLSVTTTLVGASSTPRILVALTMPSDTGICLQIPQTMSFSTTLTAPPTIPVEVLVNGVAASTSPS